MAAERGVMPLTVVLLALLLGATVGSAAAGRCLTSGAPALVNQSSSAATTTTTWIAGGEGDGGHHRQYQQQLDGLPRSVDWRAKGAVTPVKSQGTLGACWAFAAVAMVESLHYIKMGKLVSLSEQELVDCALDIDENRSPRRGLQWIVSNGGVTTESDYPYTAKRGPCDKGKLKNHAATITGFKRLDGSSELALMAAVAQQPVAVGLALDASFFKSYKPGTIYSGPCVEKKNHCLTVVGYGEKGNELFWIAKNSFGETWGDKGYVLLKRGLSGSGLCKIAEFAVYPTM